MLGKLGLPDARVLGADELDAGPAAPGGRLRRIARACPSGAHSQRATEREAVELGAVVLGDPEVAAPLEGDVVAVGREGHATASATPRTRTGGLPCRRGRAPALPTRRRAAAGRVRLRSAQDWSGGGGPRGGERHHQHHADSTELTEGHPPVSMRRSGGLVYLPRRSRTHGSWHETASGCAGVSTAPPSGS